MKEKNLNPKDEGFEGKQNIKISQDQFDILQIGASDMSQSPADPVLVRGTSDQPGDFAA